MVTIRATLSALGSVVVLLWATSATGIPSSAEPEYSQAVLAYHGSDFATARRLVDEVLRRNAGLWEARELKALVLKAAGDRKQATALYRELLAGAQKSERDPNPYRFELATLLAGQGPSQEPLELLSACLINDFNVGPSHHLRGEIFLKENRFKEAEREFQKVLDSDAEDLKPVAHLQLASLSNQVSDSDSAIYHYGRAAEIVDRNLTNANASPESTALANQVNPIINQVRQVLGERPFFSNLGLIMGYDSNVLFTPSGVASPPEGPSGRGSFRSLMTGEVGYGTSPMSPWQITGLVRGSWNYLLNTSQRSGEYLATEFMGFVTRKPLADFSYGLRLGVLGNLRYSLDPVQGARRYRTYSLLGSFAPYLTYQLGGRWRLMTALSVAPTRFFLDSETTSQFFRTGTEYSVETSLRRSPGHQIFNPWLSLRGTIRHTRGTEFRSRDIDLELGNLFYVGRGVWLDTAAILGTRSYTDRPGAKRYDFVWGLRTEAEYPIGSLRLYGGLEYQKNESNILVPYEYQRYLMNLGARYRF